MSKKVPIARRPSTVSSGTLDSWVGGGQGASPVLAVPSAVEPAVQSVAPPPVVDVPIAPEALELPKSAVAPAAASVPKAPEVPVEAEQVKMKRLTIDIPDALHRRVKSRCGQEGVKMADVIRGLLEGRFPES